MEILGSPANRVTFWVFRGSGHACGAAGKCYFSTASAFFPLLSTVAATRLPLTLSSVCFRAFFMLVSKKHRFLFIHVYKVAGTSIRAALEPLCEDYWKRRLRRLTNALYNPKLPDAHLKAREAKAMLAPELFDRCLKFAFVRNPWDWQVSLYHFMRAEPSNYQHELGKSFRDFDHYLDWRLNNDLRFQHEFLLDEDGTMLMDYVGRLETINDDMAHICQTLNIPTIQLPHVNKSQHNDYRSYYTDTTRERVAQAFKRDIELFGYDFDGVADGKPIVQKRAT